MPNLAVDVAILPPPPIMEAAEAINRALCDRFEARFVLGSDACLPHLTLAQGLIAEKHLPEAEIVLTRIAAETAPFELVADGIRISRPSPGFVFSGLGIMNKPELQKLHERIMAGLEPLLLDEDFGAEAFFEPEKTAHACVDWVRNFAKSSAFEAFDPHITLGFGEIAEGPLLMFRADNLALCHLGNCCTCRTVFARAALKGKPPAEG